MGNGPIYNREKCNFFEIIFVGQKLPIEIPLKHKNVVPSLKIQAINSTFWILVHMIAIHHCAKDQLAQLNGVQIRTP